jgi:hypothetical protein
MKHKFYGLLIRRTVLSHESRPLQPYPDVLHDVNVAPNRATNTKNKRTFFMVNVLIDDANVYQLFHSTKFILKKNKIKKPGNNLVMSGK